MSRKRCAYFLLGTIVGIHFTLFLTVNFLTREEDDRSMGKFVRKLKYIDAQDSEIKLYDTGVQARTNSQLQSRQVHDKFNVRQGSKSTREEDAVDYNFQLKQNETFINESRQEDYGYSPQDDVAAIKRELHGRLFTLKIGAESDSVCILPKVSAPEGLCPETVKWNCSLTPTFSIFNKTTKKIHVNCNGHFRVNKIDSTEMEELVSKESYRLRPKWKHYEGPAVIDMDSEFIDVACKIGGERFSHNYHTQFLSKPSFDEIQKETFEETQKYDQKWKPLSVLTVVLDSSSRAQVLRECGLPKTIQLLEKYYFSEEPRLSHQSFLFNRFNSISSSTSMNLTPLFSGELYENLDEDKVTKGIYAKDIEEWVWQYASRRGYLTSYGVDNASGMMGTRTNCKDCHYRPPVLPHAAHGWLQREKIKMADDTYSGLCEGNHFLHEYILNYTRDFLQHPHPAKWAALDLNAGHRREAEAINQIDEELADFLQRVLDENENLVVVLLGDHGKPYESYTSHLGGHYETLLPFLSVMIPSWVLQETPSIAENLVKNQQRYMVPADLHLSVKSLLHYPNLQGVKGAKANKAKNIFLEEIPPTRSCEDALMPAWSCVCGYMRKIPKKEWQPVYTVMAHKAADYVNYFHSPARLIEKGATVTQTACVDIHFKELLHVIVNENPLEKENSSKRNIFYVTFQAQEENTVWEAVVNNAMDIYLVKQYSLYQKYDVCWDKRVPLPYCVCDRSHPVRKGVLSHLSIR